VEPVRRVRAGAPLDHGNSLGRTALLEAVILGDGGPRHLEVACILLDAGAAATRDRQDRTPLDHARPRGYAALAALLERAPALRARSGPALTGRR
jgi:hypothetical protein